MSTAYHLHCRDCKEELLHVTSSNCDGILIPYEVLQFLHDHRRHTLVFISDYDPEYETFDVERRR